MQCLIWVPVGNRIGSRLSFLISSFGAATLTIWAALAPTYGQFVAARVLAALFYASPEAYGPQIVGDTFFLHQRATATGVFTAFQFCGFTFAGFIGGFAALHHGWSAPSWVMVIMTYISFLILVFFFPETSYTRHGNHPTTRNDKKRGYIDTIKLNPSSGGGPPKSSNLWTAFLEPWKFLLHSRVLLATTFFSLVLATNDYLLTTNSISFPLEYGFTLTEVALTSFAPTIGNLLGIILGGYFNDKVNQALCLHSSSRRWLQGFANTLKVCHVADKQAQRPLHSRDASTNGHRNRCIGPSWVGAFWDSYPVPQTLDCASVWRTAREFLSRRCGKHHVYIHGRDVSSAR